MARFESVHDGDTLLRIWTATTRLAGVVISGGKIATGGVVNASGLRASGSGRTVATEYRLARSRAHEGVLGAPVNVGEIAVMSGALRPSLTTTARS